MFDHLAPELQAAQLAAGPAKREIELWRVQEGEQDVRCVAVYLPMGVDLRLIENGEVRQTHLTSDGLSAVAKARRWRDSY